MNLHNPFDESWRHSLAYPFAGIGVSTAIGWLTSPQVTAIASAIAIGLSTIGGAIAGIIHQAKMQRIKREMAQVELEMLRRKLRELPAADLRPDEIGREIAGNAPTPAQAG